MKRNAAFFSRQMIWFYIGALLTLFMFDLLWSMQTTFRTFNQLQLYPTNLFAAAVLVLPFALTGRRWVENLTMAIVDLGLIANLMYCRTYFTSIPADSYFMASNLADFLPSVADSMSAADLLIPLVTVLTAIAAARSKDSTPEPGPRMAAWGTVTAATGVILAVSLFLSGGFISHYTKLKEGCYYTTCTTPLYTPLGDIIYEKISFHENPTPQDFEAIESWLDEHDRLMPYTPLPDSIAGRRDNLVIILCESLESWVVGLNIDGQPVTPFLDSLVTLPTTLYCDRVVTQVGNGRSIDCQLLLNAGMLPMENSVYSMTHANNVYHTLNKALAEKNGAKSLLLTCDKPVTWNQLPISRAFGIDSLLDKDAWHNDEMVGKPAKLSDGSFMRQIAEKLKQGDIWKENENVFMMIITYSGHNPFILPEKLRTVRFPERLPQRMRDYMEMAHYTDNSLKGLFDYLRQRPDYDRTLFVITGDHEGLAKNRQTLRSDSDEAAGIISAEQLTPFIVVNSPVGGHYTAPMGQVDMYTTILNLMRLDNYGWKGMGQSILAEGKPEAAIVSMTGETVGDTASLAPGVFDHLRRARRVSDRMITFDYFATENNRFK